MAQTQTSENEAVLRKLAELDRRFVEIDAKLSDPATSANRGLLVSLSRERGSLDRTIALYRQYREAERQRRDAEQMAAAEADPDLRAMAEEEAKSLAPRTEKLLEELKDALVQSEPEAAKDCIIEIRAGTGGDEASLFAADLYRMYSRFAERRGLKIEVLDSSQSEVGGLKEIVFSVSGQGAFGTFRYESGGHRVQRVPTTETQGRIHTSLATVGVLPEAEEVDIDINPTDLRIDTFSAGGPGGQHVNKTESAVRIVHVPTGIEVRCMDERSQHKNKARAMRLLRAKLYEAERERQAKERGDLRRSLIGSGDRSERIRTYNFPQNRITDHRLNLTLYNLSNVIEGELDELFAALRDHDKVERLKSL